MISRPTWPELETDQSVNYMNTKFCICLFDTDFEVFNICIRVSRWVELIEGERRDFKFGKQFDRSLSQPIEEWGVVMSRDSF